MINTVIRSQSEKITCFSQVLKCYKVQRSYNTRVCQHNVSISNKNKANKRSALLSSVELLSKKYILQCSIQCCSASSSSRFRPYKKGKFKNANIDVNDKSINSLVQPVEVKPAFCGDGVQHGDEIPKAAINKILDGFFKSQQVIDCSTEEKIDSVMFKRASESFRRFCTESQLPRDIHIVMGDILQGTSHVDDLFSFFYKHTIQVYPHIDCYDDLVKLSDLREPATWYPNARDRPRRIIYHSGPTNSGKTHGAFERFKAAKSGIYCGPLRLLAAEMFHKANAAGTKCDLVTGEERLFADEDGYPSNHVACTVEMTSVNQSYEVAVIDEIQMVRDMQRGWAWTRAFLGLCADEIHVCGEDSGVDIIRELAKATGDSFEVEEHPRLNKLVVLNYSIDSFDKIKPGDCIVCFNKNDIYHVSRNLENLGVEVAVIYGTLSPGAKMAQAEKFNNPESSCKVLVATDAIGMGLNLNIKRVIFYSLRRPTLNNEGSVELLSINPSTARQIAGRAGRFSSGFTHGEVTTFRSQHLPELRKLMKQPVETIIQAGIAPTAEQIEMFGRHLPKESLSSLINIFVRLCQLDNDKYFLCNFEDFKTLADMIEEIPLQLGVRYVFCCAPINLKDTFVKSMFHRFAMQFRKGPLTFDWVARQIDQPFSPPKQVADLNTLESVFDILDLYLWLGHRFPSMFPDGDQIREMQKELDQVIQAGVAKLAELLNEPKSSSQPNPIDFFHQRQPKLKSSISQRFKAAKGEEAEMIQKISTKVENLNLKPADVANLIIKNGFLSKDSLGKLLECLNNNVHQNHNNNNNNNQGGNNKSNNSSDKVKPNGSRRKGGDN